MKTNENREMEWHDSIPFRPALLLVVGSFCPIEPPRTSKKAPKTVYNDDRSPSNRGTFNTFVGRFGCKTTKVGKTRRGCTRTNVFNGYRGGIRNIIMAKINQIS